MSPVFPGFAWRLKSQHKQTVWRWYICCPAKISGCPFCLTQPPCSGLSICRDGYEGKSRGAEAYPDDITRIPASGGGFSGRHNISELTCPDSSDHGYFGIQNAYKVGYFSAIEYI